MVDWFRCQATVKVGDQGMMGRGQIGGRDQQPAGGWNLGVSSWSVCTHSDGRPMSRAVLGRWPEIKFSPWPWNQTKLSDLEMD